MSKYNHDHKVPFEIFLTDLTSYNNGILQGCWVEFPTTHKRLEEAFKEIGIGSVDEYGEIHEEWFITDYDIYVDGLYYTFGEYANLDELNYLAIRLEQLTPAEYEDFCAIVEAGGYSDSIADLINLTLNLDAFEVLTDVESDYDLGYYYIEEAGIYDMTQMGNLANYIDYERFGRDIALEEGGTFTIRGYVVEGRDSFVNVYNGLDDIPNEYRVLSGPGLPVQDKTYEFDDYKVDVQINSDNDFDYTIYRNGKHIDGGILENPEGYDSIQPYVIEEIKKMHDLDQQKYGQVYGYIYDEQGMHGERIEFEGSPANMANFIMFNSVHPVVITDELDQFVVSSVQGGFLDRVAYPALREEIIQEILPLQLGDRDPIDIAMQDSPKDQVRDLARKIDNFMFEYDFYEYKDQELYPGYNLEQTTCMVRKGNFEPIKHTLKEVLEGENVSLYKDAEELLKLVERYEKDNHIQVVGPSINSVSIKL